LECLDGVTVEAVQNELENVMKNIR
jgi:hypothetical protein